MAIGQESIQKCDPMDETVMDHMNCLERSPRVQNKREGVPSSAERWCDCVTGLQHREPKGGLTVNWCIPTLEHG